MATSIKVIAQIDRGNSSISTFHAVLGNEVKQVGVIEYPTGTTWADGTACNEAIRQSLEKCFSKTIRNIQKQI